MKDNIEVSVDRIKVIITGFKNEIFTTAEILRVYSGGFYSNVGTPAYYSFNAQFGKLLKRNAKVLNITEIKPKLEITDDIGRKTKSSRWQSNT
ncbi:MAG: hypothetical protein IPH11_17145 [Ignavibacteriales bacterium]|nr:hypothetical protein [Ignavibacteriales bacterium]